MVFTVQASNSRARSARPVARTSDANSKASSVKTPAKDSMLPSTGEVEGPAGHAGQAPRAHPLPKRPWRQPSPASQPPPTIVGQLTAQSVRDRDQGRAEQSVEQ